MNNVMLACLFFVLTGFGCSTTPKAPDQAVYAAEGAHRAALVVAVAYKRLPQCNGENAPMCSKPEVLEIVRHSDNAAAAAILAARKAVCTVETTEAGKRVCKSAFSEDIVQNAIASMQTALNAFRGVVATLPQKETK